MRPVVLGVDSSTGSTKVEARALEDGDLLGVGRSPHPATTPPRSEQDPAVWWAALVDAVAQLGDLREAVVAMSVAGQQHGLVVTDATGVPLRPAKLWNDTESAPQADRMVAEIGAQRWASECGSVPVAAFTITKLAWLAENEPTVLAGTERVFLPHDWLTFCLTGEHVTDRGDASGTGWYRATPARGSGPGVAVADDVIERALGGAAVPADPDSCGEPATAGPDTPEGLSRGTVWPDWLGARLPRVLGPVEPAGRLTPGAAAELGLPVEVVVGPGTGDNMAAALGLGLRTGDVVFSLGTSGTVYTVSSEAPADPSGAVAGFADATGRFLPLVCTLNATKVTDTVAAWLGTDPAGLSALALQADPSSRSIPTLVPYFDGERTPNLPEATGALSGLRTETTREELALAAHDGVLQGLIAGRAALKRDAAGFDARTLLVGGGARSEAYRQRLADLLGTSVTVPDDVESVAAGAAVQAAAVESLHRVDQRGRASTDVPELLAEFATRWGLGSGQSIPPRV